VEYVDQNLKPLLENELDSVVRFHEFLSEKDRNGDALLVYRGEELRNIKQRLFKDPSNVDHSEILEGAFYIGEKARSLHINDNEIARDYLTGINDCSSETFYFIFDRMVNVLSSEKLKKVVRENTSTQFREYFLEPSNRVAFVEKVLSVTDSTVILRVRDYYLYLLHVAGSDGVRVETTLISTSTDKNIARYFSKVHKNIRNKVIFHYYVPAPFFKLTVSPWLCSHYETSICELGLPRYKAHGLFPKQKEVCIKGALFPHFILGVELLDKRLFVVNPLSINLDCEEYECVLHRGFNVDHSDFEKRMLETAYQSYAQTDLDGNFEQHNV